MFDRIPHGLWLAGFWLAVLVLLALALLPLPPHLTSVPFIDKYEHVLAFFVLMVLGQWAGVGPRWKLGLGLVGLGVGIELAQALTAWRQGDVADAVADALGIGLALLMPPMPRLPREEAWTERVGPSSGSSQPGEHGR